MVIREQSFWSRLFNSRIFLSVMVLLIIFIGYSIFKEKKVQTVVRQDIRSLEAEIASLENKSLELAELIKYLRSDEYVEQEAREKLGMQKEGEKVVIVPESEEFLAKVAGEQDIGDLENWRMWVEYFFGN